MSIRAIVPDFNFVAMPRKSEEISAWLASQPSDFSFPFVSGEALAERDGDRILGELLEYENGDGSPFHEQVTAMHHLHRAIGCSAVAVQEVALVWHIEGGPLSSATTKEQAAQFGVNLYKQIHLDAGKSCARKILDLRQIIARDHLKLPAGGDLNMDYLNFLDKRVLPCFFKKEEDLDEFSDIVYPRVTGMMALLDASGMFEYGNIGYTQSLKPNFPWRRFLISVKSIGDAATVVRRRIALPPDIMANGDLAAFFGLFTEKSIKQPVKGRADRAAALILAGLGDLLAKSDIKVHEELSKNPANAVMLSELCCAALLMTWDRPILSGDNCQLSKDGKKRLIGHALGGWPDSFALYGNNTILTLEPSLHDGKTVDDWLDDIDAAMSHASGQLNPTKDMEWESREGCAKFSFLIVQDLPVNPFIMKELLKVSAAEKEVGVFPASFGMMQALCQVVNLHETHHDAIRRFLFGMKADLAHLYQLMNKRRVSSKGYAVMLRHALMGDMAAVMVPLMVRHLKILLKSQVAAPSKRGLANNQDGGKTHRSGPGGRAK